MTFMRKSRPPLAPLGGGSKGVINFPWILCAMLSFVPVWALPEYIRALIHAACLRVFSVMPYIVPAGSPSRGGDVKVCVLDINQPSLPTPFTLFFGLFLSSGPFTCISFHKFSRQFSVFSLCSPSFISALLVLSTIYFFLKVSLVK